MSSIVPSPPTKVSLDGASSSWLTLVGQVLKLTLVAAGAAADGIVTTAAQTFAGAKTFANAVIMSAGLSVTGAVSATTTFRSGIGSAAAVAYGSTGDDNTGIWFPAGDTINVVTGGSLRLQFSATGSALFQGPISMPTNTLFTIGGGFATVYESSSGVLTWAGRFSHAGTFQVGSVLGAGASDVGVRLGFDTADASVNATAKPLSVGTGIGGSYVEKFWVTKDGALRNAAGTFRGASASSGFVSVDDVSGIKVQYGSYLINLASGLFIFTGAGGNVAYMDSASGLWTQGGTDSSGTPGAATINKPSGKSAIAGGATTVVITNSLVAAGDQVHITWHGDLGTQSKIPWVTTAAGSFSVNVGTAPAGAVAFCWTVQKRL